jgi:hypothetical protein
MDSEERYAPVGKVSIIDAETGETLVDTHNMIVKEGRRLIAKAVFGEGEGNDPAISKANFKFFYEQNDANITTADTKFNSVQQNINCRNLKYVIYYNTETSISISNGTSINDEAGYTANITDVSINQTDLTASAKVNGLVYSGKFSGTEYMLTYTDENDSNAIYYLRFSKSGDDEIKLSMLTVPSDIIYKQEIDDGNDLKIHLGCAITFDKENSSTADYEPIYAIGLVYCKDTAGTPDTLFSRATFDPVYMRKNRTYIVHYTIYF